MNLNDILQRVYSATDRNPNTAAYKAEVTGFLNDSSQTLYNGERWLFLEKRSSMTVYPDYTTGTVTVTNGSRSVTANNAPPSTWGSHMNGHQFVGPDGETYTIAWVDTVAVPNKLYLTSNYAGAGVAAGAYTIRFFAYTMPDDCVEPGPLSSRDDDRGRISYIDNETEATVYLDRDDTGDPYLYLPAGSWQTRTMDTEPAAVAAAGGALTASTVFSYLVTIFYEGVEGPPSKVASAATTGANKTINLSALQDLRIGAVEVGYRKRIYRKEGAGAYYFLAETTGAATTYADAGATAVDFERPLVELGTTHKVWFYPRPDAQQDVELWYRRRPRRMQKDQDVPDCPPEFHEVLWRMASVEILRKYNQPTASLERVIEDRMVALKRRWLARSDRRYRMNSSWTEIGAKQRFRNGIASIT